MIKSLNEDLYSIWSGVQSYMILMIDSPIRM